MIMDGVFLVITSVVSSVLLFSLFVSDMLLEFINSSFFEFIIADVVNIGPLSHQGLFGSMSISPILQFCNTFMHLMKYSQHLSPLRFVTGDYTLRNVTSPFGHFYLGWTILRMGRGLHFLVEIELEMAKMPAFTNLNIAPNWITILHRSLLTPGEGSATFACKGQEWVGIFFHIVSLR